MTVKEMQPVGRPADCSGLSYADAMREPHTEISMIPQPQNLVGTWRRFGAAGPVYEIIGLGKELPDHDRMMRVRVVETGEELDYRLAEILDDPRER
jgi:hypothetical protein